MGMADNQLRPADRKFLKQIHRAAARRAAGLGISEVDYLIGILEGRFPRISAAELKAAATSGKKYL